MCTKSKPRGFFALLKITTLASFLRKRGSTDVGPRFRGGDEGADFHSLGWAAVRSPPRGPARPKVGHASPIRR
jgi:hypothetical protein